MAVRVVVWIMFVEFDWSCTIEWLDDVRKLPIEATTISPTFADMPALFVPLQANLNERVTFHPMKLVTGRQKVSGQPAVPFPKVSGVVNACVVMVLVPLDSV